MIIGHCILAGSTPVVLADTDSYEDLIEGTS